MKIGRKVVEDSRVPAIVIGGPSAGVKGYKTSNDVIANGLSIGLFLLCLPFAARITKKS